MTRGRILIVEDDRFYRDFYRDVLEKEGYRVDVAHSGREALRILDGGGIDLVITDVLVKGSSGLDLLAEIKTGHPAQDVIMVTSMQSLRKAVEALKLGASDYLTKPVDRDELLVAIAKILERQVVIQEHSKLISENIHFYELLRIQKRMLHLLSIMDLERLQDAVLDALIQESGAAGALLFLLDGEGRFVPTASRGIFDSGAAGPGLSLAAPNLREELEGGRPLFESGSGQQWVPKPGDEAQRLLLPVCCRREFLGAVKLLDRSGGRNYGTLDADLGRNLLEAAGIALRNALDVRRSIRGRLKGGIAGTYDPAYFHSFAEQQMSVSRRYNRETALVLVRVENLGRIRQQFKENQVRQIVDHLSHCLLEVIRETDLLSLLEDDLFGIFVPETDFYGALMLKKRIRARISRATFPLDMKRDMVPILSIGCAACPEDGAHYQTLLDIARRRLAMERESVYNLLRLDGHDFWSAVGSLMKQAVFEHITAAGGGRAAAFRPLVVTEDSARVLVQSLLRDLAVFFTSRGLLYLGISQADPLSPYLAGTGSKESLSVSVFALGAKGDNLWNIPCITPVFIKDGHLQEHIFALGITEHYSYGLCLKREGPDELAGFHTSDELLVMELVTRLQEKYLLQRRIG